MQPAFLSFILIAVHVSVPVDCTVRVQDPEPHVQHPRSSFSAPSGASAGTGRFYFELKRPDRKAIRRQFHVVLPLGTDTSNVVVIFDLRRRRFLCMDLKGKLYKSRQKDREECFFQHIWFGSENPHRHLFYSVSGGRLLKLEAAELGVSRQEQPEPSSALWERFLGPLVRRQRRSEEVNPSDPLRSQSHPSHPVKDHKDAGHRQPEQDQTGAVSKETITSCDDPLLVLQANGPVSPIKTNIADRAKQD